MTLLYFYFEAIVNSRLCNYGNVYPLCDNGMFLMAHSIARSNQAIRNGSPKVNLLNEVAPVIITGPRWYGTPGGY